MTVFILQLITFTISSTRAYKHTYTEIHNKSMQYLHHDRESCAINHRDSRQWSKLGFLNIEQEEGGKIGLKRIGKIKIRTFTL